MQNTIKIFRLLGQSQHYSWGGDSFIPELLGVSNDEKKPFAEYWMGAHDKAPAFIQLENGTKIPLNRFLSEDRNQSLGSQVNQDFGRLPYLFKVLDVKDMLSIQVHPSKKEAVKKFETENKKGVALDAADRNYKDDNHKPELMYALSDFWLLHGFKEPGILKQTLNRVKELNFLLPVFEEKSYAGLYRFVMEMDEAEVKKHLQPLLDRIIPRYENNKLDRSNEDFWAARAAITFNQPGKIDRGIFSIYLFNVVHLKQGEAIFQDAGLPHAYLEGQNMEIMANSDNVLRGGLTTKHIDVAELMKHVKPEALIPEPISGSKSSVENELVYLTPAADFELRKIELEAGEKTKLQSVTAEIFIVLKGVIKAQSGSADLKIAKGECFLALAAAAVTIEAVENAVIFRATVPSKG